MGEVPDVAEEFDGKDGVDSVDFLQSRRRRGGDSVAHRASLALMFESMRRRSANTSLAKSRRQASVAITGLIPRIAAPALSADSTVRGVCSTGCTSCCGN